MRARPVLRPRTTATTATTATATTATATATAETLGRCNSIEMIHPQRLPRRLADIPVCR